MKVWYIWARNTNGAYQGGNAVGHKKDIAANLAHLGYSDVTITRGCFENPSN